MSLPMHWKSCTSIFSARVGIFSNLENLKLLLIGVLIYIFENYLKSISSTSEKNVELVDSEIYIEQEEASEFLNNFTGRNVYLVF